MKKLTALLLVMMLLVSVCVFSTSAALKPLRRGDMNDDWDVDISDVTIIQRILAHFEESSPSVEYIGDVDGDGSLSVFDATTTQRWLAGLISDEEIDIEYIQPDIYLHDGYADYESGKAMAGVPVTFTINADSEVSDLTYVLYVDDQIVKTSNESTFTYTFEQAGRYHVSAKAINVFTDSFRISFDVYDDDYEFYFYEVVEPYKHTTPEITSTYITGKHIDTVLFDRSNMKAHVEVKGGVAPYQYKFELTRPETIEYKAENITITQDFSEKNYFELENINHKGICFSDSPHWHCELPCELKITVKDANGDEATKTMYFVYSNDYPI